MTQQPRSSDMNERAVDEQGRRKRVLWLCSIANLTLIILLTALWFQTDLTVQVIFILAIPLILVVNGAVWLGSRLGRDRELGPLVCFAAGGLAGADAIVEIATKDYASAGAPLIGCVAIVVLGVLAIRNNAKKDAGEPGRQ